MNIVLSYTDGFFLSVLAVSLFLILKNLHKKRVRRSYLSILQKPLAVCAGIIWVFFLLIGVLDSIHYKTLNQNTQIVSLLDSIVAPMGTCSEKTYSSPLALELFTQETSLDNGKLTQNHPRLQCINESLKSGEDVKKFIWNIIFYSLVYAGCATLLPFFVCKVYLGRKISLNHAQWGALITFFCLFLMTCAAYWVSRDLHVLGTGKVGQDIFYYSLKSIRTSLVIGLVTIAFMLPFAIFLGIAAGYFGGAVDDCIQTVYTILSSIPGVLLITASVLSMQTFIANHPEQFASLGQVADARLLALCVILGLTSWTGLCRLLRAETLKLKAFDYVLAARAIGSSSFFIIHKHIMPNIMHIVLITAVLDFSFLVLAEAVLSYVGVGVSPLTISFGNMINSARLELARDPIVWWPMASAMFFMLLLVLPSNLVADAVQDAFNPYQT